MIRKRSGEDWFGLHCLISSWVVLKEREWNADAEYTGQLRLQQYDETRNVLNYKEDM